MYNYSLNMLFSLYILFFTIQRIEKNGNFQNNFILSFTISIAFTRNI